MRMLIPLAGLLVILATGCGSQSDDRSEQVGSPAAGAATSQPGVSAAERARARARAEARQVARKERAAARKAARKARAEIRRIRIRARALARRGGDVDLRCRAHSEPDRWRDHQGLLELHGYRRLRPGAYGHHQADGGL